MLNGAKRSEASRRLFASLRMTVLTRLQYKQKQVLLDIKRVADSLQLSIMLVVQVLEF
ncbi:hypothetical protein RIVM261_083340 [Rivularia sp. IAM M-261]|nr:hypothetical protein RIVM261_083340 [Rivularia sp. IAM M-261]